MSVIISYKIKEMGPILNKKGPQIKRPYKFILYIFYSSSSKGCPSSSGQFSLSKTSPQ